MTVSIELGRVGSNFFTCSGLGWVGLGQLADGLAWVGSHRMDPWATLYRTVHVRRRTSEIMTSARLVVLLLRYSSGDVTDQ